jgi:hypothetical protein
MDPQTGASVEVFYADRTLANSFGRGTGWFWWTCQRGFLPNNLPTGPFATGYAAYRNFALVIGWLQTCPRQPRTARLVAIAETEHNNSNDFARFRRTSFSFVFSTS